MSVLDEYTGSSSDPTTVSSVKNKQLAQRINEAFGNYDTVHNEGQSALGDYINNYFSDSPNATKRTGQEIGTIDRFYNGGVGGDLATMRLTRQQAVNDAASRAAGEALAGIGRSRVGMEGGPSSYDKQLALRSIDDVRTKAALDNSQQERSDYDYLTGNQLNLAGRRQGMADQLSMRPLVPEMQRRQLFSQDLGFLGQLGQEDQANTFYGLKNHPGIGEGFTSDYGQLMDAY